MLDRVRSISVATCVGRPGWFVPYSPYPYPRTEKRTEAYIGLLLGIRLKDRKIFPKAPHPASGNEEKMREENQINVTR